MLCKELLSYHIKDERKAEEISSVLNSKYPSHSYPILLEEAQRIGLEAKKMAKDTNALLLELNSLYSEMGQKATTDFNESSAHSNEILNILETEDLQVYFQEDKDWFYRTEERRWITMNDNSSWRKVVKRDGEIQKTILHIA